MAVRVNQSYSQLKPTRFSVVDMH